MKGLKFSGLDMKEMKEIIAESNISFPFRHYQRNQERSLSKQAESFEEKLIGMDIEQELLETAENIFDDIDMMKKKEYVEFDLYLKDMES